mmetsp:Transcript_8711/g.20347  ORF Transcript_8711/g.20347 Transcript_8711/m.20347 type:complete len:225 (-) Transcript_8711:6-680(-)
MYPHQSSPAPSKPASAATDRASIVASSDSASRRPIRPWSRAPRSASSSCLERRSIASRSCTACSRRSHRSSNRISSTQRRSSSSAVTAGPGESPLLALLTETPVASAAPNCAAAASRASAGPWRSSARSGKAPSTDRPSSRHCATSLSRDAALPSASPSSCERSHRRPGEESSKARLPARASADGGPPRCPAMLLNAPREDCPDRLSRSCGCASRACSSSTSAF